MVHVKIFWAIIMKKPGLLRLLKTLETTGNVGSICESSGLKRTELGNSA